MNLNNATTITAISTAPGTGAIGIIRLSGPDSLKILKKIFIPKNNKNEFPSHKLQLGEIKNFKNQLLDIPLAVYFQAPYSFTGEDSVEIHAHGGAILLKTILELTLEAGAQLANPGEFSQRAFLNGKLELSQAESIIELIEAQSSFEITLAAKQLAGKLKNEILKIHTNIFKIYADLEMVLNFYDDIENFDYQNIINKINMEALEPLKILLENRKNGRILKDGLKIILTGAPNVGKSSLFNALLNEERALVSNISGTTRDYINAETIWDGLRIELFDTAGLSEKSNDLIEKEGQKRAIEKLKEADLILWLKDASKKEDKSYLKNIIPSNKTIIIYNKKDLLNKNKIKLESKNIKELLISAKTKEGIVELKNTILEIISPYTNKNLAENPNSIVPNLRQEIILQNTCHLLKKTIKVIEENQTLEIVSFELRDALNELEHISGKTNTEDLLSEIFSNFCVGK